MIPDRLLGGVLVLAFADLRRLGRASDAILSENHRSIQAAEHMINALDVTSLSEDVDRR